MAVWNVIDHYEMTGTTASFEKTSIDQSYDHLYMVASVRDVNSSPTNNIWLQLNGEGSNFYSSTHLDASTSAPGSGRESTGTAAYQQGWIQPRVNANTSTADTFGIITMWIPNYSNTANFKQVIISGCGEGATTSDGDWRLAVVAGLFHSQSAITEVKLSPYNLGSDWVQYSTWTIYGVKGA